MKFFKVIIPILWDRPLSKLRWAILVILTSFAGLGILLAAGNSTGTAFLLVPSVGGDFVDSWRGLTGGLLVGVGIIAGINLLQLAMEEEVPANDH
jgi:hypothetical protein